MQAICYGLLLPEAPLLVHEHSLCAWSLLCCKTVQQRQSIATMQSPPTQPPSKSDLAAKLEELFCLVQVVLQV